MSRTSPRSGLWWSRRSRTRASVTGAPVLGDALAAFDCVVADAVDVATHTIFICRVVDVRSRDDGEALVWESGGFGSIRRDP
jgi:flavin reductase (DIM6/NTAB) family NADH-FMN oxidoreductase RutF